MQTKSFLVLEDNTIFEGTSFGFDGDTLGEAVFNTSLSGYQEILTDPSYCGQIVSMTYPMIGNYGVNDEDVESSRVQVAGFVVKEYAKTYSNFRATKSLSKYLEENRIVAIEGIDTRKLTRHIRDKGAMRAGIFRSKEGALDKIKAHASMNGLDLASAVMCKKPYDFGDHAGKTNVAVFDFGIKTNILRLLDSHGFAVRVYPGNTPLETALKDGAECAFLSNGPGDPAAVHYGIKLVQDIAAASLPCFGICLGHQMIALGLGAKTYKLKFGHRGGNQPVKNLSTGSVEITSQNHGFAVDMETMKSVKDVEITHVNLNDNTVEGIRHTKLPLFSVQYHPESNPGPHDSVYLFQQFKDMVAAR
jgi:carbamoyl-phosphate synthase small subunit